VNGSVASVIYDGDGVVNGVRDNMMRSRVWPAWSCDSWNGADVPLELRRAEVGFGCPWRRRFTGHLGKMKA
jgi:hypothetical protein